MLPRRCVAVSLLLSLVVVGCGESGPPTFPVTGSVTYQGKPLPLGSVMFVPQDKHGQAKGSPIDANGHYQLDAAAGEYMVEVQMIARLRSQPAPDGEGANMDMPVVDWLIPEKYNQFQTSGLKVVVEPKETNQIDLPLP
ncbi:MAG: hypothetical protein JW888_05380 [Pirellulales bacterium]|nr:hypothetical protein [Pirellulales bacterium]